MNDDTLLDRIAVFTFGGFDWGDEPFDSIVLLPENTTSDEFKEFYNQRVLSVETHNNDIQSKLEQNSQRRKELSNYFRKFEDKVNIADHSQKKIDKKYEEMEKLLQEYVTLNKELVPIDPDGIIHDIGGKVLERHAKHRFSQNSQNTLMVD